ncbi:hypothetical protein F9K77_01185 [Ochrobactrum sp. LMG 5442]|nr:hypothetical protein F9K77_01185 [Ochrobactrum sp. LMG 5442]
MTNAVIGALRVNLGIDTAEFREGLKSAQSSADKFAAVLKTTFIGVATAAAGALGSLSLIVNQLAGDMDGLKKSADLSGVGIEEFQRLAFAAKSVQIESEKLSDIFKDVNDKVGDFAQTGGGALKDFFENIAPKVGLTADAFKNLSGPEALQAYYNALEKAGVSQSDMTFYMEAIASDATALIPLLRDNGKAFDELGAKAAVITEEKAASLRGYNDAMRNLSESVKAVGIAFISVGFVDILTAIINKFAEWTRSMSAVVDFLPTLAEYATVAGSTLALMFSPVLIASAVNLASVIATGLVGAIRLLTAAIAANPLGALAIGITIAVTAIYHFRDEIQKAIGVDVVQIVKDAVNGIIGTFVGGFEGIKKTWSILPAAIGDVAATAANAVIESVEGMVRKSAQTIETYVNKIVGWLNALDRFVGVNPILTEIDISSNISFGRVDNKWAGKAAEVAGTIGGEISAARQTDYIGAIGTAFSGATPAVQNFASAMGDVNSQLNDVGGGGGGSGGKGGKGKGAGTAKKAKEGIDQVAKSMESAKQSLGQGFGSIFEGLINKTMTWRDAIMQAGQTILKYLNQINVAQGGAGLFGGGIIQGLFGSLLGFANGGSFQVGGSGGIDSQLVAFKASPNERVSITKPGQDAGGGRGTYAPTYNIDARGADQAAIMRLERGLSERDKAFGNRVDNRLYNRDVRRTRA